MKTSDLDLPDPDQSDVFLCVNMFKHVYLSIVFTCHLGKPKVWNAYPVHRTKELKKYPCELILENV